MPAFSKGQEIHQEAWKHGNMETYPEMPRAIIYSWHPGSYERLWL
jgi:hypothetical protein